MLLIMAAEVMDQAAKREGAVTLEYTGSRQVLGAHPSNHVECLGAGGPKGGERVRSVGVRVGSLLGDSFRIYGGESWMALVEDTMDAYVIAVDLDIAYMAHLLDCGEVLARNAVPCGWR